MVATKNLWDLLIERFCECFVGAFSYICETVLCVIWCCGVWVNDH